MRWLVPVLLCVSTPAMAASADCVAPCTGQICPPGAPDAIVEGTVVGRSGVQLELEITAIHGTPVNALAVGEHVPVGAFGLLVPATGDRVLALPDHLNGELHAFAGVGTDDRVSCAELTGEDFSIPAGALVDAILNQACRAEVESRGYEVRPCDDTSEGCSLGGARGTGTAAALLIAALLLVWRRRR